MNVHCLRCRNPLMIKFSCLVMGSSWPSKIRNTKPRTTPKFKVWYRFVKARLKGVRETARNGKMLPFVPQVLTWTPRWSAKMTRWTKCRVSCLADSSKCFICYSLAWSISAWLVSIPRPCRALVNESPKSPEGSWALNKENRAACLQISSCCPYLCSIHPGQSTRSWRNSWRNCVSTWSRVQTRWRHLRSGRCKASILITSASCRNTNVQNTKA